MMNRQLKDKHMSKSTSRRLWRSCPYWCSTALVARKHVVGDSCWRCVIEGMSVIVCGAANPVEGKPSPYFACLCTRWWFILLITTVNIASALMTTAYDKALIWHQHFPQSLRGDNIESTYADLLLQRATIVKSTRCCNHGTWSRAPTQQTLRTLEWNLPFKTRSGSLSFDLLDDIHAQRKIRFAR
jgi:hypothetical protein